MSGFDDFGDVLVVFFFSMLRPFDFRSRLGVEIQDFDVDSFHLQASPRVH